MIAACAKTGVFKTPVQFIEGRRHSSTVMVTEPAVTEFASKIAVS